MKNKLELKNISYSFGDTPAIENFSLSVEEGSFTTLLGPSGCGKTTLLRLISGFLEPSSGQIFIDEKNQQGIEVNQRQIGLVFQDYALFPHMTVYENLLYGLKIKSNYNKKTNGPAITNSFMQDMIVKTADDLDLNQLLNRYPNELSGGQQQRVALGRAIVLQPKLLLMDEPLSSLDTKLRTKVRQELKEIQEQLKITTVYVTHDQEEALSLSSKIAVINKGKLLQEGTPQEIYFEPKDMFTADFIGKANFISTSGGTGIIRPEWFELVKNDSVFPSSSVNSNLPAVSNEVIIKGKIISTAFLGGKTRFIIEETSSSKISKNLLTVDFDTLESANLKSGSEIILRAKKIWEL